MGHVQSANLSLFLLRVVFGTFLVAHGVNKVKGGIRGTAGWFGSIGMRWPLAQAVLAAATEIGAGGAMSTCQRSPAVPPPSFTAR